MRILLINPLVQQSMWEDDLIANWPPLGLAYLAAVLEQEGHEVRILERKRIAAKNKLVKYTPENLGIVDEITRKEAGRFTPDFIGITATTALIMDGYHTAKLLKKDVDVPIVFGGYHPTFDPVKTLKDCEAIDVVVAGEGELSMTEIVHGKKWQEIEGIAFRQNGEIVANRDRKPMADLDHLPFPARHLLDTDFYFAPSAGLIRGYWAKGTTIFTARGCPFVCAFCQSPQMTRLGKGKTFRAFSPEYVVREIRHLVSNYGLEAILFSEDIFNIDHKRATDLCDMLIETGLSKKIIWAADMRVDLVDPELLKKMAMAGCVRVIYGTESGSQQTLDSIVKKATVEEGYNAIRWTKEAGMSVEANIIIGLPGERPEDFEATIGFLREAKPDMVNRGKFFPLPGTGLYSSLRAKGIVKDHENWDEIMDYYTRAEFTFADMSIEQFEYLKARFDREVTLRRNYLFNIKTNLKRSPFFSLEQFIVMLVHISVLYLPLKFQKLLRKLADALRVKSRLVFPVASPVGHE